MLRFNRFGTELWPATLKVRVAAGVSYRTVQRHIDALVGRRVLIEVYPANTMIRGRGFRRSATYRLDPSVLKPRPTWQQFRDSQPALDPSPVTPIRPQSVRQLPPSPDEFGEEQERRRQRSRKLTMQERASLVTLMTSLMTGRAKCRLSNRDHQRLARYWEKDRAALSDTGRGRTGDWQELVRIACADLAIDHADCLHDLVVKDADLWCARLGMPRPEKSAAPVDQQSALLEACKRLLIPIEPAIEALKLAGFAIEPKGTA
jgi:hypothetical protein